MVFEDFWGWLTGSGLITGDPNYYSSGDAQADEYGHAVQTAFEATAPDSTERKSLIDKLWGTQLFQGDKTYWYGLPSNTPEVSDLRAAAQKFDIRAGGEGAEIEALPRNARLINVNGQYRVVWDLEDGLGHAWYSITQEQLTKLYEDKVDLYVTETFGTEGAYQAKYGDYFWGNVAEIDITAENPWDDLKSRTFEAFGYVAGFDDPEVKRIVLQGHFEGWSSNEFLSHYQQTDYYKNTTTTQRTWDTLGPEERERRISSRAAQLVDLYRGFYGVDPISGTNNTEIRAQAEQIESGQSSQEEWNYTTRRAAEQDELSPAGRDVTGEERERGEREVTIENRGGYAQERWEYWMGPTPVPGMYKDKWGRDLYMNKASEEDLEESLRALSQGTWALKPENLGWAEWAAPTKANMRTLLELSSVDDQDPLLANILAGGLQGREATTAIRNDSRFRSTNRMFEELSSAAHQLGRTFGFIA